jgi:cation transport regulator
VPYKNIEDLPKSVKILPKEAQQLFLKLLNKALEQYDTEEQAFAVAWDVVKKKWKKQGDEWVKMTSATTLAPWADPLIIEGPAIPIGKRNKNGWGIKRLGSQDVIDTLKQAVVRICDRNDEEGEHGCDTRGDPKAEIGRVIDVRVEDEFIKPIVAVTDRVAKVKIEDGTWEPHWSVFGHADHIKDGWAYGVRFKALTLVRNPAWKEATFRIASATDSGIDFEYYFLSPTTKKDIMDIVSADGTDASPCDREGGDMEMEEMKKKVEDLEAAITQLKEENTKLKTENDELIKAATETSREGESDKDTFTKEEVEAQIKAAIENREEELKRENLASDIVASFVQAGIIEEENTEERLKVLSKVDSEHLNLIKTDLDKLIETTKNEVKAGRDIAIPANNTGDDVLIKYEE